MGPPTKKHKGVACVHCRQMKLRCDSGERFPAPCSRCHKAGRNCSINPSFKRTARRDRLDQLERELHMLRNNLGQSPTGENGVQASADSSHEQLNTQPPSVSTEPETRSSPISDIQILEQVVVSRELFMTLLDEYYQYYHARFPFLPPKDRLMQESASCRLLFWAIVAVASRSVSECRDFQRSLIWPIRRLAMESAIRETPSLSLVQAYLLLCIWNMPFGAMVDDPSSSYCAIAINKAQLLGLHHSNSLNEFAAARNFDSALLLSMRATWLACFIVNQNISAKLGLPNMLRPDHTIMQALNDECLANPTLRHLLELAYKEATFSNLLGQNASAVDGLTSDPLPIIQAADLEIEQFEMQHRSTWSSGVERSVLGTKLRLYSYAFLQSESRVDRTIDASSRRISISSYLPKCYIAAMRLIDISCSENATTDFTTSNDLQGTPKTSDTPQFLTSADVANIILATCVLLQLTRIWTFNKDNNNTEADNAISGAWNLLSHLSISKGDHYNRICDIIQYISKAKWDANISQPTLLVKSRMGASIQWDLIQRARRRFVDGQEGYSSKQLPEVTTEGCLNNSNVGLDGMMEFSEILDERTASFEDILWPMWDESSGPVNLS